ncbi:MAG: carboxypeptidase-like regulatory domain-containing protein, partial [Saprospiraceae bacterium]|nr:carboxypeptidase-like regulatory domain-containing protein [Saprospiraceae bacterium]
MKKLVVLWLLLLPVILTAQQTNTNPTITISVKDMPIITFLENLERDYDLRFYFKPDEVPDNQVTLSVENKPLDQVLQQVIIPTGLGFIAYEPGTYVLMPSRIVNQVYTADFYKALEKTINLEEAPAEEVIQSTIGSTDQLNPSGRALVKGFVVDKETGEPIIGATIFHPATGRGTASDIDGSYELNLPTGEQEIQIQFVGYQNISRTMLILSDGTMDVNMASTAVDLSEIVVEAEAADANVNRANAGVEQLDVEAIKKLPSFLGEADVVKSLL